MLSKHGLILSIWIIFFVLTTLSWIFKNNLPPAWDQANYLEASEYLYKTLTDNGISEFLVKTTTVLPRKAPLIAILPIPFYWVFGSSPRSALLVNITFFVLFAIFFYLLLEKIWEKKIALTAVFICSTMPLFYGLLRNYLVEFGLMTIVVIWIYVLLKTESFQAKKYLVLLGIISGLGMLMKFHFFLFIIGPFFLALLVGWKKKKLLVRDLTKLFYIAIPAFLIAAPWYSRNILTVLWHAKRATNPEILGSAYYGPPFSLRTISLSLTDLINFAISSYWFLILIILLLLFWFKGKKLSINYLFLSWFIIPFLIFFFGPNKDYRLMLPLLPPIGIFIAWLFWELFPKRGYFLLPLILFIPVIIYINTTITSVPYFSRKILLGPLLPSDNKIGNYAVRPKNEYWPIREVLVFLNSLTPQDKTKTIILASEHESFNINNLKYYTVKERLNLEVKSASYFSKNSQFETVKSFIEKGDYLIMKIGGDPGSSGLNIFNDQIEKNINWPEIPNKFAFPDGGRLFVAKKL